MNPNQNIRFVVFLLFLSFQARANDVILHARSATSLNKVTLYPDSTFSSVSNTFFSEGALFEVLSETYYEHEDDAQNQKFKWYQVKSTNGHTGWIFGDGLAVIVPDEILDPEVLPLHKKYITLDAGFEKSIMWIASIEGRDNFHEQDYLNPPYQEYYVVITNQNNKSVHINYAGLSARGKNELHRIQLSDVTGDNIPEFILEHNSFPIHEEIEHRGLEIYTVQSGTLIKIFEERTSLNYADDTPAPSLYKFVEIDNQSIRVEYINYIKCDDYSLPNNYGDFKAATDRCMEFITYTYKWNERQKKYLPLYEQSRSCPKALVKFKGLYLREKPSMGAKRVTPLKYKETIKVIRHHEKYVLESGEKKIIPYFYVQTKSGKTGYISAEFIDFIYTEHAELLSEYYKNPPLVKKEWSSQKEFTKCNVASDTSAYHNVRN